MERPGGRDHVPHTRVARAKTGGQVRPDPVDRLTPEAGTLPVTTCQAGPSNGRAGAARGRSSMVEPQPSKLVMRVRFPSPAPTRSSQVRAGFLARSLIICQPQLIFRAMNVPLTRRDQHPGRAVVPVVLVAALGLDVGVEPSRDGRIGAASLVLVDQGGASPRPGVSGGLCLVHSTGTSTTRTQPLTAG